MRPTRNRRNLAKGLTLLELVVVMAILIALAAILVPLLPELLGKANQSAAVTNLSELEKAIPSFRAIYGRYPNYFDSLVTSAGKKPDFVPQAKDDHFGNANITEIGTLGSNQAARLNRLGINKVYHLNGNSTTDSDFHATLNPYGSSPTAADLAANSKVWRLARYNGKYNDEVLDRAVLPNSVMNDDHDYVMLGIGRYCNLCGPDSIVKEAPVFGQHKQQNTPSSSYQRYVAIFDVGDDKDPDLLKPAKFIAVVAVTGKRLFTTGDIVATYGDGRFDIAQPRE